MFSGVNMTLKLRTYGFTNYEKLKNSPRCAEQIFRFISRLKGGGGGLTGSKYKLALNWAIPNYDRFSINCGALAHALHPYFTFC